MARRSAPRKPQPHASSFAGPRRLLNFPRPFSTQWRAAGARSKPVRLAWEQRLAALDAEQARRVHAAALRRTRRQTHGGGRRLKHRLADAPQEIATRAASEFALDTLTAALPEMIGGSADLTGSNNTLAKGMKPLIAAGLRRHLHSLRHPRARHGVGDERHGAAWRRHSLFGHLPGVLGLLPAGDPARRLDGPARDPGADAPLDRARRGRPDASAGRASCGAARHSRLKVFRPCDTVETVECWQLALESKDAPSVLALSRQNLPQLRLSFDARNFCARGAYELIAAQKEEVGSLLATGSEVASGSRRKSSSPRANLGSSGLGAVLRASAALPEMSARPLSATPPSMSRSKPHSPRLGRDHRLRRRFRRHDRLSGPAAPAKALYQHFGITAEKVAEAALPPQARL